MKKTININLGGLVFQIDEDAFDRLNKYLEALKQKFHNIEERNEIIQDIEYRFAELFGTDMSSSQQVVSIDMVQSAITTMGAPEEIENDEEVLENEIPTDSEHNSYENVNHRKLFRDPKNQVFAGVISGISKYFGIHDAIWFRISFVLIAFATGVFPIIPIYILLWIVTPLAKTNTDLLQMSGNSINIGSIQNQVKKNINSDEIKRTTAKFADKAAESVPVILKVLGIGFILFFSVNFIGLTIAFFGGSFAFSMLNPGYLNLLMDTSSTSYIAMASLYIFLSTPLILSIYLGLKMFTKKKINWILSIVIASFLMLMSFIGLSTSIWSVTKNFRANAEQTNYVALENPAVSELNIEFPYEKLKEDLDLNFSLRNDDEKIKIDGFKIFSNKKEIHINMVSLNIEKTAIDTVFKLTKTALSKGKTIEDAEERISHITNDFDIINENSIAIPRLMVLKNETKWRVQQLNYKLTVPVGKKIYFGDNAKKVIDEVKFNGDYSRKDLANNTWQMTKNGLKCLTCQE